MNENRVSYLLAKAKDAPSEVISFWKFMGSPCIENNTKIYIKDTLYKVVEPESLLFGGLVYCLQSYTVDDSGYPPVDWTTISNTELDGLVMVYQGVTSPIFKFILEDADHYEPAEITRPFENDKTSTDLSGVAIDDENLEQMLIEVGVPFLSIDELEYTRETILKLCVKPALKTFYGFFPIIREQLVGEIGPGGSFEEEFPIDAYHAIAYYVLGSSGGTNGYSSPFAFYREQMIYGGNIGYGSGFGTGIHYHKLVPGWTGLMSKDAALQGLATAQAYTNYFRREKVKVIKKNGRKYATGYSTIGGTICIKWLCASYDFEDVDLQYWPDVMALCKANILRALGQLRVLVKADLPGSIDFSIYNSRADKLEDDVLSKWKASPTNLNLGIMRGGLG